MKPIIIRCGIYDCYWNIGSQFRRDGNCSAKRVTISLDYCQCAQYIERGEAQARLAKEAFRQMEVKNDKGS